MRGILLALFAAVLLLPAIETDADWRADLIAENTAITATDATSDQTSALIQKPRHAVGLVTWLKVTAPPSGLLLDIDMEFYSPTVDDYVLYFENCPNPQITGASTSMCVWNQFNPSNDYTPDDQVGFLPTYFRLLVMHGNATAATYVLHYQWLFKEDMK
jgi:hypothetical protein